LIDSLVRSFSWKHIFKIKLIQACLCGLIIY
jgi:hypothetical protein